MTREHPSKIDPKTRLDCGYTVSQVAGLLGRGEYESSRGQGSFSSATGVTSDRDYELVMTYQEQRGAVQLAAQAQHDRDPWGNLTGGISDVVSRQEGLY